MKLANPFFASYVVKRLVTNTFLTGQQYTTRGEAKVRAITVRSRWHNRVRFPSSQMFELTSPC